MGYRILYACVTHPGKIRRVNQDNFICGKQYMKSESNKIRFPLKGSCSTADTPLFGVFDGMGGEQCGEVAAQIAARYAYTLPVQGDGMKVLTSYCQRANRAICNYAAKNAVSSMGTTAAMLLFSRKLILCNIGDSKVFRFRSGKLEQISTDHVCQAPFGVKPALSQSLGIPPEEMKIQPYLQKLSYADEDLYLICSDGLTDMVANEEIQKVLETLPPETAAEQLLEQALANGGKDNTTILICKVEKEPFRLFR